jgi:hypothetical protein
MLIFQVLAPGLQPFQLRIKKGACMKFWAHFLVVFVLWTVPMTAHEREDRDAKERLEFQMYSHPKRQRYTFEDYIGDLKAAARSDEIQPGNPASQMASSRRQEYKPLNPIVVFRW